MKRFLLQDKQWDFIKGKFSESEVEEINYRIIAASRCPRGVLLDLSKMNIIVLKKLQIHLKMYS